MAKIMKQFHTGLTGEMVIITINQGLVITVVQPAPIGGQCHCMSSRGGAASQESTLTAG